MTLTTTTLDTPIGTLTLVASETGLRSVYFPGPVPELDAVEGDSPVLAEAARQLEEYFDGMRTTFDLPLDLHGTSFQVGAWRGLAEIPYGETVSYGEQARRLGKPEAVRAVGAANGRNPLPIVLPCHRVIGADGSLTGFGGGLHVKQALLDHEAGVRPLFAG
jgi:methylated-DNA-[protein]-cysteine S-methyltransferase